MMPITHMNHLIPLPEHGNNQVDQQEIGEQQIDRSYSLYSPVLLWTSVDGRVRLPYRGNVCAV